MTHFTEHSAVGGSYALNRVIRPVRVKVNVVCRQTVFIDILRGYLTVFSKLFYKLVIGYESALTVRNRNTLNITRLGIRKPRGFIRSNARSYYF